MLPACLPLACTPFASTGPLELMFFDNSDQLISFHLKHRFTSTHGPRTLQSAKYFAMPQSI